MIKYKEFKTPTNQPIRVMSDDGFIIAWVYPEWRELDERLWRSALSQGCISKDMNRIGATPGEAIAVLEAQEKAFFEGVKETIRRLVDENDPETLDVHGKPKIPVLTQIIGEPIKASLRDKIYEEIKKERK